MVTTESKPRINRKLLKAGEPFDTCAACGHDGGFHLVPCRARHSRQGNDIRLLLRCPNCGAAYDTGLMASVG